MRKWYSFFVSYINNIQCQKNYEVDEIDCYFSEFPPT